MLHSFQAVPGCHWPHSSFLFIILLLAGSVLAGQNASAILDGGLGLSADQLIDASRGDYVLDLGIAATPQESRDIWENESGINFSKPETIAESSGTPQSSRSAGEKQFGSEGTEGTSSTSTKTAVSAPSGSSDISSNADESGLEGTLAASIASSQPASGLTLGSNQSGSLAKNAAGNWTFRLTEGKTAILALNLYQSDGVLFGSGSMNDGGDSLKTQASGWIEGSNLSLDVTTSGDVRLYRLSLSATAASEDQNSGSGPIALSGSFRAYAAGGASWTGTAEGEKRIDWKN